MKKKLFFAAVAIVALASCSSDEMIGVTGPQDNSPSDESNAIVFAPTSKGVTRADLYGSQAAGKLGNKFVVYGTKHAGTAENETANYDAMVFNNFQVAYTASTAATTASNSSDWEYVGLQAYGTTPTSQGIKYWDYSAVNGYTFYAFSSSNISFPPNSSDLVSVTKITSDDASSPASLYNKGYNLTVKNGAALNNLYFSDRLPVAKTNFGKTVDLTFRNIGAKVRFGFYETIPGYDVKIDNFLIDEDANAAVTDFAKMKDAKTDGSIASLQNVKRDADQNLKVTYYNEGVTINRPKITNPGAGYYYTLKLGSNLTTATKLSDNAANPTWDTADNTDNHYTPVFPFEDNTNPLLIKLDFTMKANDGSGDEIKVRGARAIVPTEYVKWKSNFAYTYLFKISDKSNGTTGAVDGNDDPITDPEGLMPITFDAIVVDVTEELQQTITSVSTNSITTYAEGAIVNEYYSGKPIYVAIENNSTRAVITPSAIGSAAGNAQVYSLDKAATESEVLGQLTGSPMGITMTSVSPASIEAKVPLVDGTEPDISNVKFTPSAAGTYAYVYTTKAYVAPTYTVQNSGTYNNTKTYYMRSGNGVYFAVTVPNEAAFNENKASLYLKTDDGTPGVYDVKVIKVQ